MNLYQILWEKIELKWYSDWKHTKNIPKKNLGIIITVLKNISFFDKFAHEGNTLNCKSWCSLCQDKARYKSD